MIDVVFPRTFGSFEFNQISGEVGIAVVRSLPRQFHHFPRFVQDFEAIGSFRFLLDDQVDGGIVTSKSICGHARKQGRVFPLRSFDTDS